jgi:adenine-specific DNA-methyltransferase
MADFYETVLSLLKQDKRFVAEDGTFLRNAVYEAAMQMDTNLIHILLSNEITKTRFFKSVDDILVFDKLDFAWVINNRNFLPDSYTRFKNKIGLANEKGEIISTSGNIVLVFPYKDCVLEGGQTIEDKKRKEIFYNETLAPDEVDRLLYPKVLTNATKYSYNGDVDVNGNPTGENASVKTEAVTEFTDTDNLIIKGNNLLGIASLLKRYEGQIELIFIDIPYNTGNDSFQYNDNFNHSTWLTFMKNRLDLAYRLLKPNGSIALYVDNNEIGYLQVIMDEIFGRENRGSLITVKRGSVTGHKAINPGVVNVVEYILVYAKKKAMWNPNKIYRARGRNDRYDNFIKNRNQSLDKWEFVSLLDAFAESKGVEKKYLKMTLGGNYEDELYEFVKQNAKSVIQFAYPDEEKVGQETRDLINESRANPDKIYLQKREKELDIYLKNGQRILFYSDRLMKIDGELVTGELVSDFWDDVLPNDLAGEGSITFKKGKKPEKAVKRVIELFTNNKTDIVLDFFMGSGTIPAVCHKMGLHYIGIEQMDYVDDITINRLKAVITGNDKKGVTKALNWVGGGSFIYCELAKLNQNFVEEIERTSDSNSLKYIYHRMVKSGFISCKVKPEEINENASEIETLTLDEQKHFLMELLDKNLLYVNYCDMDDAEFNISAVDKAFTKSFYNEG